MGKIVVTGGFGFIGSNLIKELNKRGFRDIILVDFEKAIPEHTELLYDSFMSVSDFLLYCLSSTNVITADSIDINTVFHMGAITDTLIEDKKMVYYNTTYSETLAAFCNFNHIPLFYASSAAVYGNSKDTSEDRWDYTPLNLYGISKWMFDNRVRENHWPKIWGFRFFNVYGPGEFRKGNMASQLLQLYANFRVHGYASLFKSIGGGVKDGEQSRDFIHVDSVVNIILSSWELRTPAGIYNVGTGCSTTFNCLAFEALQHIFDNKLECPSFYSIQQHIVYKDMPKFIEVRFQHSTQANVEKLQSVFSGSIPAVILDINRYYSYLDSLDTEVFARYLKTVRYL